MNKAKEPAVQAMLNMLNMLAKEHDIHISSTEDMLLKVDGVVVARMYYDATERRYVKADVLEHEAHNG